MVYSTVHVIQLWPNMILCVNIETNQEWCIQPWMFIQLFSYITLDCTIPVLLIVNYCNFVLFFALNKLFINQTVQLLCLFPLVNSTVLSW